MSEPIANQTDEFLAQEAGNGVLESFDELVLRYQHRIYGFVLQSVSNRVDASEVTQDVFLRAFTGLSRFNPEKSFSAWLFAIARNRTIDHYRSRKVVPDEPATESPDYDDPSELLARREDQSLLWARARQLLPDLQFQSLWLRYVEDMEVSEIATVLGKTKTHVKVLLFRARRMLAAEMLPGSVAGQARLPIAGQRPQALETGNVPQDFCSRRRQSAPTV